MNKITEKDFKEFIDNIYPKESKREKPFLIVGRDWLKLIHNRLGDDEFETFLRQSRIMTVEAGATYLEEFLKGRESEKEIEITIQSKFDITPKFKGIMRTDYE